MSSPKKRTSQASIMSFFGGGANKQIQRKEKDASLEDKENQKIQNAELEKSASSSETDKEFPVKKREVQDDEDEEEEDPTPKIHSNKKRRRVIEDSDEEDEAMPSASAPTVQGAQQVMDWLEEGEEENKADSTTVEKEEGKEIDGKQKKKDQPPKKSSPKKQEQEERTTEAKKGNNSFFSPRQTSKKKTDTTGSEAAGKKQKASKGETSPTRKGKLSKEEKKAGWAAGAPVPYKELAEVLEKIEATSGRLDIQNLLKDFFESVIRLTPSDLATCVYLCCNKVAPAYKGVELGIGDSLLIKAICNATGRNAKAVKSSYEEEGDLGLVAQSSKSSQKTLMFAAKPKPLSVRQVLETFRSIAAISGGKSGDRKVGLIQKMLLSCTGVEPKFLIRGLQGKLRIGLAEQTVLVSLSHAMVNTEPVSPSSSEGEQKEEDLIPFAVRLRDARSKEDKLEAAVNLVKQAYSECPNYDELVDALLTVPLHRLHTVCHLEPGVPVFPMLAKPTKSIDEVMGRVTGVMFTCEFKYDGERAQVHLLPDGTFKIFSRNSEDNSQKYPDIMDILESVKKDDVTSFVIDAEVVAYNHEDGVLLPFQVLSTRKRKEENKENIKVQVILQAFDLLYLNGKSYLQETLQERREALRNSFNEVDGKFRFAVSMDHMEDGDTAPIEAFLEESVKASCEGLMVKTLIDNSSYEPSKRSLNWLKLKKDYLDNMGVADSIDVVPIGAYMGKGKRTGTYGAYLLACYDPETEDFQSLCKIGTGFSDEALSSLMQKMKEYVIPKAPPNYMFGDNLEADVWFSASKVWEIRGADLSKSSTHKCALGKAEAGRGIGLRFPRFLRERDDKGPEQATSCEQILEMYYKQDVVGAQAQIDDDEDGFI